MVQMICEVKDVSSTISCTCTSQSFVLPARQKEARFTECQQIELLGGNGSS